MKFKLTFIALLATLTSFAQNNTFPSSGNVGIGTTSPDYNLDIHGKLFVRGDGVYHNNPGSGDLQIGYGLVLPGTLGEVSRLSLQPYGHTGGPWKFIARDDAASAFLDINYGTLHALTVHHAGNVGIGIMNPTSKLEVNGNIRAKEIKVEAANWPDYVFDQDYKILGLNELDAYIKANKHLPDMPSSKDAEANGVELGEMNKLLLKKIEELTLHLIEKDKEIGLLKTLNTQINTAFNNILERITKLEINNK
nr:hypothetical protein [uncultured Pedobacter sp.]